jgi:hypothetical protein
MTKLARALLASAVYLIVLVAIYGLHMRFFRVDVVLYAAVMDAVLAAVLVGTAIACLRAFDPLNRFEKTQLVVIWLVTGYSLAITLPAVIDRSLSIYLLEKLDQRGGDIAQASFEDVFVHEYMVEHRLVDVRLTEQVQSGTITIEDGCVRLTERGARIVWFSRYFRTHWLPRQRLLMGSYSDDLTDPFRNSPARNSYRCGPGNPAGADQ